MFGFSPLMSSDLAALLNLLLPGLRVIHTLDGKTVSIVAIDKDNWGRVLVEPLPTGTGEPFLTDGRNLVRPED